MEPADGLSGGVRTHGLLIPNQARCQLRHTQMFARLSGPPRLTTRRPWIVFPDLPAPVRWAACAPSVPGCHIMSGRLLP